MLTLGIETSCDETSCAVLENADQLLSNVISSSLFRHQAFGGVVPEIASRHCLEQIDFVLEQALKEAGVRLRDLDLVAVTRGPGLIGSLLVGVSFAKALAYELRIPLVGVNHLDAHLMANFIGAKEPARYVGLIVSGGHTSLSYHERGRVRLLGETVDDAAGEAYDKVAKMLGLGYPGGPVLDKLAAQGDPAAFRFTKPKQKNRFDFSFSGIKTAVLHLLQKDPGIARDPRDLAASFQNAVAGWLTEKALDAAVRKKVRDIVAGGGVCANSELRKRLTEQGAQRGLRVWFPTPALTLDNAGMIARRGYQLFRQPGGGCAARVQRLKLTGAANLTMGR